jgi:hypothetical protein
MARIATWSCRYSDGRRLELPVDGVSVLSDGTVRIDVDGPGDSSLRVRYSGPGLEVRSARVGISDTGPEKTAEFREVIRNWRSGEGCLWWAVHAEIAVASAGTGSGRLPEQSPETT